MSKAAGSSRLHAFLLGRTKFRWSRKRTFGEHKMGQKKGQGRCDGVSQAEDEGENTHSKETKHTVTMKASGRGRGLTVVRQGNRTGELGLGLSDVLMGKCWGCVTLNSSQPAWLSTYRTGTQIRGKGKRELRVNKLTQNFTIRKLRQNWQ